MELTWTTFVLELINFLVLVWVLKRLFYEPVKRAIAQRKAGVEKTLKDAKISKNEAQDLKAKYEGRVREWEQEKEVQKEAFRKELSDERARQLKLIETAVAMAREKAEAQEQKDAAERRANDEKQAINQALEFTSRLFGELASPAVEGKIVDLLVHRLSFSNSGKVRVNGANSEIRPGVVQVRSAYLLSQAQRDALSSALKHMIGTETTLTFEADPKLVAGLEIVMGSFVVRANLRDELEYFSMSRNHD